MKTDLLINEVGPRAGVQSVARTMPTAAKTAWTNALHAAGADEVGLSDMPGTANPARVRRLFLRLQAEIGERAGEAGLHNTLGQGRANVLVAGNVGVRTFDTSLGGLGGYPYAPGASGNVVTGDLVFMFEAIGIPTGIDIERRMDACRASQSGLPGQPVCGMTPDAGLTKGFAPASRGLHG